MYGSGNGVARVDIWQIPLDTKPQNHPPLLYNIAIEQHQLVPAISYAHLHTCRFCVVHMYVCMQAALPPNQSLPLSMLLPLPLPLPRMWLAQHMEETEGRNDTPISSTGTAATRLPLIVGHILLLLNVSHTFVNSILSIENKCLRSMHTQ